MASLKAVQLRMKSVNNIKKITSAMKMVSAAKFKHDERRMLNGTPFAKPVVDFFNRLPATEEGQNVSLFALSSDKGLCGGINSGIAKISRNKIIEEEKKGSNVTLLSGGNKAVGGLKRLYGDRLYGSYEELQKEAFNFSHASLLAERLQSTNPDRAYLAANAFKSMIAYDTNIIPVHTKNSVKTIEKTEWSKAVDQFEFEPAVFEVWEDLHEWYYACVIFQNYLTGIAAEQSARMAAMENASKNCGEVIEKLTIQYNRARQAKITTELCEIIAGASAV